MLTRRVYNGAMASSEIHVAPDRFEVSSGETLLQPSCARRSRCACTTPTRRPGPCALRASSALQARRRDRHDARHRAAVCTAASNAARERPDRAPSAGADRPISRTSAGEPGLRHRESSLVRHTRDAGVQVRPKTSRRDLRARCASGPAWVGAYTRLSEAAHEKRTPSRGAADVRSALERLLGASVAHVRVIEHSCSLRLHGERSRHAPGAHLPARQRPPTSSPDPRLMLHEYCHVISSGSRAPHGGTLPARMPAARIWNNRFEVEARAFADTNLAHLHALLARAAATVPLAQQRLAPVETPGNADEQRAEDERRGD